MPDSVTLARRRKDCANFKDCHDLRPFHPPRGVLGPGPKLETELKMSPRGLLAPGPQKVKNRVEKESKSGNFNSFSTFLALF